LQALHTVLAEIRLQIFLKEEFLHLGVIGNFAKFSLLDSGIREAYSASVVTRRIIMGHGIIWWIVVGLIAGWAAGKIMKGGGYGVIADIVLGIVGAIIGGWVVGQLGFGGGGLIWSILVAILGAVILIWITRLIKKV